jgi:hypothetical protein
MATTLRAQVETDPSARGEIPGRSKRPPEPRWIVRWPRSPGVNTRGAAWKLLGGQVTLAPAQVTTVIKTVTRAPKASEVIRAIADRIRVVRELEPRWWILLTAPSVY